MLALADALAERGHEVDWAAAEPVCARLRDHGFEAMPSGNPEPPSKEAIAKQREFTDVLTKLTVVTPKLSDADLSAVPFEDKEFLVEIATRQRDLDAEGNHIGGLQKSADFRRFRGLDGSDEDVEGL